MCGPLGALAAVGPDSVSGIVGTHRMRLRGASHRRGGNGGQQYKPGMAGSSRLCNGHIWNQRYQPWRGILSAPRHQLVPLLYSGTYERCPTTGAFSDSYADARRKFVDNAAAPPPSSQLQATVERGPPARRCFGRFPSAATRTVSWSQRPARPEGYSGGRARACCSSAPAQDTRSCFLNARIPGASRTSAVTERKRRLNRNFSTSTGRDEEPGYAQRQPAIGSRWNESRSGGFRNLDASERAARSVSTLSTRPNTQPDGIFTGGRKQWP